MGGADSFFYVNCIINGHWIFKFIAFWLKWKFQIYPAAGDWREALNLVEKIDRNMLECLSPHYTNFKPNSYVYTKALAEQICESYKNQIPITIVRPSIVTGTEHEPVEGWNDNFNGPGNGFRCVINECNSWRVFFPLYFLDFLNTVGLLAACGLGIMRTMYASRYAELNCVAVDIVAKTLIVAAWKNAMENQLETPVTMQADASNESRQLRVYNCASLHNMDLDLLVYDGQYLIRNRPFEKAIWIPGGGVTLCKFMNFYRVKNNLDCVSVHPSRHFFPSSLTRKITIDILSSCSNYMNSLTQMTFYRSFVFNFYPLYSSTSSWKPKEINRCMNSSFCSIFQHSSVEWCSFFQFSIFLSLYLSHCT